MVLRICISKQFPFGWPLITPSSNMTFLSNFTLGWPQLTPARPLTPSMQCTLVWGPFYQIWWPHGISKEFDLWLTLADPCVTSDPNNKLHFDQGSFLRGPSYQIWWPYSISKQFDLWLTLADPCMTCDPSNALCFGQGFSPPNLVAIGHF